MSPQLLLISYFIAFAAGLAALYFSGVRAWYMHLIGLAAGAGIGLIPPPAAGGGNWFFFWTGVGCVLLATWGFAGLILSIVGFGHSSHSRPANTRAASVR